MNIDITLLEQEIMSDIDERRELMSWVKLLCARYGFLEEDEQLFLCYSIPIVYSIWEGFVQTSFQIYIRELNKLQLGIDDVCDPILIYHIESKFPQFKQYPKADANKKVKFFNDLRHFYKTNPLEINPKKTESNVGFKVLNRILKEFSLEEIPQVPRPGYPLNTELHKLLDTRNKIAHGQGGAILVRREDLERAIKVVEELMDLVFERIKTGFIEKSYLK
ncbi:MAE_28990/MAE_18760 family HEPN-like nuclease [Dolichospermum planctonicum CS-1226]|uniref:MAE_28990/MAE_18760 family HEPN-like nuclease n=1 Tax=Dolichospermum planctonicum CS-1226 TaxID=3021751 RepID=A0ABT5ADI8_9CYAN|nr:MAE_28990/MAE_18760 family HEPN-like nuclease [Dolichospermum planctonicum]MDB9534832.1 MAE_28990/MAE_18760 family HEPN-like nuclease [Dolichospermum planctonicum CS-1226]